MKGFQKTIATAVTRLLIVMAIAIFSAGEAGAKSKAPFDKSYLPPGNMAKVRRPAKIFSPSGGVRKAAKSTDRDGTFRGIRNSRRSYILPYIEQDNLYR